MTRDIGILRMWFTIVFVIAVIGTNLVPIIFAMTQYWRAKIIGRLFMAQSVMFAAAIDVSLLFRFWRSDNILVLFWIQTLIFTGIAGATFAMAWGIWTLKSEKKGRYRLLFNHNVYEVLKKIVQIILPGLAGLYFGLAQIWDLPKAEEVVGSIAVLTAFLGAALGISTKTYNSLEPRYDGIVTIKANEGGTAISLDQVNVDSLVDKDAILVKVVKDLP